MLTRSGSVSRLIGDGLVVDGLQAGEVTLDDVDGRVDEQFRLSRFRLDKGGAGDRLLRQHHVLRDESASDVTDRRVLE